MTATLIGTFYYFCALDNKFSVALSGGAVEQKTHLGTYALPMSPPLHCGLTLIGILATLSSLILVLRADSLRLQTIYETNKHSHT